MQFYVVKPPATGAESPAMTKDNPGPGSKDPGDKERDASGCYKQQQLL